MGDVTPLDRGNRPARRALFTDERGAGLRVTRHTDVGLVVLSLWRKDTCVGTFQMPLADAARLASFLVDHLAAEALGAEASRAGKAGPSVS